MTNRWLIALFDLKKFGPSYPPPRAHRDFSVYGKYISIDFEQTPPGVEQMFSTSTRELRYLLDGESSQGEVLMSGKWL